MWDRVGTSPVSGRDRRCRAGWGAATFGSVGSGLLLSILLKILDLGFSGYTNLSPEDYITVSFPMHPLHFRTLPAVQDGTVRTLFDSPLVLPRLNFFYIILATSAIILCRFHFIVIFFTDPDLAYF